jgi:hypothetical protein
VKGKKSREAKGMCCGRQSRTVFVLSRLTPNPSPFTG